MLINIPKRYFELQRIHVHENGGRNSYSGVNATVFGSSGILGMCVGSMLTRIGSTVIYPYRNTATIWDVKFKEIKPTADVGYKAYVQLNDFTN